MSLVNQAGSVSTTLFFVKFPCVHMRCWAGPGIKISVFATKISDTGMKIFPYEHSSLFFALYVFSFQRYVN